LNLVSGHVQLLKSNFQPEEPSYRKLELIESQINRLSEIVRRFLSATPRPKLDIVPLNLPLWLPNISSLILPTLQSHQVQLTLEIAPDLPALEADPKQLEQVLLNLINNSLDAMPRGGELRIGAASANTGNKVLLQVTDTGEGIEPSNLERLFLPMYTTKEIGAGTGLGLAICRSIIKEHGGEIKVESQLGLGTTFTISLPVKAVG
jgi:signal transduction histidine kinase